jgi:hypothetical protein
MNTLVNHDPQPAAADAALARLALASYGTPRDLAAEVFAALAFERGLVHLRLDGWATEVADIERVIDDAVFSVAGSHVRYAVLDLAHAIGCECIAGIRAGHGTVDVRIAAAKPGALEEAHAWVRRAYPPAEPTESTEVPITFWAYGAHGSDAVSRTMAVATWPAIEHNYPGGVRAELGGLMADEFRPSAGGQLLLWYGPPGTGKTHALRALAWSWRSWCDVAYVVDPDALLGERADYLLEVLLDEADDDRWRLLVLEDTGELLTADAKQHAGQGLSRLLNVVDGLVGQGLRVLVLVTTNEPLGRLHEAIARPGRCASRIEFDAFPPAEADAWLARHDAGPDGRAATLAQLYGRLRGDEPAPERVIGFS